MRQIQLYFTTCETHHLAARSGNSNLVPCVRFARWCECLTWCTTTWPLEKDLYACSAGINQLQWTFFKKCKPGLSLCIAVITAKYLNLYISIFSSLQNMQKYLIPDKYNWMYNKMFTVETFIILDIYIYSKERILTNLRIPCKYNLWNLQRGMTLNLRG